MHKPLLTEYSKDVFDEKRAKACSALLQRYDAISTKDFIAVFEDWFNQTIEAINSNKIQHKPCKYFQSRLLSVGDNALNNVFLRLKGDF
ncbi:MAG: hypothetical protein IPH46_16070 [Bacteroidetes bacterium]|nr:hypothetical protein [Bacteroidota bacterium]